MSFLPLGSAFWERGASCPLFLPAPAAFLGPDQARQGTEFQVEANRIRASRASACGESIKGETQPFTALVSERHGFRSGSIKSMTYG